MSDTTENLCLHYASARPPNRRFTLSVEALRQLVVVRLEADRVAASLADYAHRAPPPPGAFTLSFDDGHRSIAEHVAPVLSELGVPATFFIPTAYVETSDEFVTWDDVRRLRDAGFTLGSHAHTHPRMPWRLYDETTDAQEVRLVAELETSRALIERELGEAPALFAYPYGEAPDIACRAAVHAGFAAAFTVAGDLSWSGDLFRIPRLDGLTSGQAPDVSVQRSEWGSGGTDDRRGFSVVVPACGRLGVLADVVTRLASQSYPEERYEVIVVDDGSPEDLAPAVREMPDNVRLVRLPRDDTTVFHAGQARAHGASVARFDHLAFLDADVAVGPDHLWHLDYAHRHTEEAVVLGYLSGYNLHDLGHLHTPDAVAGRDLASLPIIPDRSREPTLRACLDNLDWLDAPWPLTYTGNLSLSRALFERVGGFDEAFVGWGLEDIDLGYRLHRAGGRFVFARFAVGYHVVDPHEGPGRNPFRAATPARELFRGYLANLTVLEERHGRDPAVQAYVARARADIDETCRRPMTVGIEFGGAASRRTRYHRRIHRMQPGGVPRHELLDRVAYAKKVSARTVYLLGGAPAEHPAFAEVVRAAKEVVSWVSMQTLVYPFGQDDSLASLPLDGAIALVHSLDRATYERLHGHDTFAAYARGLDRLAARVELGAHLVVSEETEHDLDETLRTLESRAIPIEELTVTDARLKTRAEAATGRTARVV